MVFACSAIGKVRYPAAIINLYYNLLTNIYKHLKIRKMKKLFLLIAVSLFTVSASNAQTTPASLKKGINMDKKDGDKMGKREDRKALRKLEGNEVSYQSKQAFATDFGNITPLSTERLDNFDEFTFTKNNKIKSAFYDIDSKLVGTIENKTFADLPSNAQKEIKKQSKSPIKEIIGKK